MKLLEKEKEIERLKEEKRLSEDIGGSTYMLRKEIEALKQALETAQTKMDNVQEIVGKNGILDPVCFEMLNTDYIGNFLK